MFLWPERERGRSCRERDLQREADGQTSKRKRKEDISCPPFDVQDHGRHRHLFICETMVSCNRVVFRTCYDPSWLPQHFVTPSTSSIPSCLCDTHLNRDRTPFCDRECNCEPYLSNSKRQTCSWGFSHLELEVAWGAQPHDSGARVSQTPSKQA